MKLEISTLMAIRAGLEITPFALAEALGLPSDRIANLSTAALFHDIGKIGIPDELLRKKTTK